MIDNYTKLLKDFHFMLFDLQLPERFSRQLSYYGAPIKLNARLSGLGRELRQDGSYSWNGLKRGNREFILWQFTLNGRGRLDYEGQRYDLQAGEAMLLHIPHRHHYYFPPESSGWEFIYMLLGGIECCRICRELEAKNGPVIRYGGRTASLVRAEEIFALATASPSPDPLRLSQLAYSFCMELAADLTSSGGVGESRPPGIEAAVRFALRHFEDAVGVAEMSEAAGMSRFHFSRQFEKHMEITPGEFLRRLRLEKATRMLQAEQIGLEEIARRSGFQSASYFCRAFRRAYGMAPGEFRDTAEATGGN